MKPMTQPASATRIPPSTKKAASVEFRNVTKRYGEVTAVDDVSFTIEPGKLVTLLGPSGCGKTTTLRMIAGLEMASGGQILIGDRDVTNLSAADRDVSMVFQSYALFPHMSVLENVAYGPSVQGVPKKDAQAMAMEKLSLIGLSGLERRSPSELSGGQQQRVAVARALVLEPQVLLFDEPLSNLDAKLRRRVREDIRELQQSLNLTVAYVTHDQEEALAVSDHIIVMSNARIAQTGSPRELYEEPADLFVADFIGDANILTGTLGEQEGPHARVQIGGLSVRLPHRGVKPGQVKLAVRPDAIVLNDAMAASASIRGVVTKASYLGTQMEYEVETPVGNLFVVQYGSREPIPRWRRCRGVAYARTGRRHHPERLRPNPFHGERGFVPLRNVSPLRDLRLVPRRSRGLQTAPSSGILRIVPQALQCTASLSWRFRPQAGQVWRTLLGRRRTWIRRRNSVTPQIMMTTAIR